jgi:hypothetical protein
LSRPPWDVRLTVRSVRLRRSLRLCPGWLEGKLRHWVVRACAGQIRDVDKDPNSTPYYCDTSPLGFRTAHSPGHLKVRYFPESQQGWCNQDYCFLRFIRFLRSISVRAIGSGQEAGSSGAYMRVKGRRRHSPSTSGIPVGLYLSGWGKYLRIEVPTALL